MKDTITIDGGGYGNGDGMGKIPTLKRKDVINASGLSARTIDRLVASGELPAYRIGKRGLRFHEDDVAALFRPVRSARAAAEGPSDSKQDDGAA